MSLLDWIANKQKVALGGADRRSHLDEYVRSMGNKVAENQREQISASSFTSVKQRDSLVMQRILGQQPARGRR